MNTYKEEWNSFYVITAFGMFLLAAIDKLHLTTQGAGHDWKVELCVGVALCLYAKLDAISQGLENLHEEEQQNASRSL